MKAQYYFIFQGRTWYCWVQKCKCFQGEVGNHWWLQSKLLEAERWTSINCSTKLLIYMLYTCKEVGESNGQKCLLSLAVFSCSKYLCFFLRCLPWGNVCDYISAFLKNDFLALYSRRAHNPFLVFHFFSLLLKKASFKSSIGYALPTNI